MVILCILAGLLFIYLSGHYIATLMNKSERNPYLNLAVGYVFTQLIFLVGIYISNAYYSFYFLISLFFIFTLINIKSLKHELKEVNFKVLGLLIVLICLLGYVYIYYGLEAYWHTASEDCFDAINGKDYILGNISALKDFMLSSEATKNFENLRGNLNSYLYGDIPIQYSSVTFWSIFFNNHSHMDSFLIQSIINLIMMFLGIVLLTKTIFKFSNTISYLVAFISVYSNLYITTYFNTHEGSLIFGAIIPYLLYLFFIYEDRRFKDKNVLVLLLMLSLFLLFTYKHPYVFFMLPALVYVFRGKVTSYGYKILNNKIYLFLLIVIAMASFFYMYSILEHYLSFKESRFRSWSISLEPEMILIYWGLVQSGVTNIGASVGAIYHNLPLKYFLYVIAFLYTAVTIYGYFHFSKKHVYFKYFIFFWILFFIVFRFVLGDSYYFYKFLYTTQFVFFIFFIYALKNIYDKNKASKIFSIVLFTIFLSSNIYYNISSNNKIYNSIQNKSSIALKEILEIPKDIASQSYLEIPKQYLKQIAQVNLRSSGIFTKIDIAEAKYIILMKNIEDIYFDSYMGNEINTVYENNSFRVIEQPKNYLSLYGGWESEVFQSGIGGFSNIPFKWMSNIMGPLYVQTSMKEDFLQACFESGPSIGFGKFDINLDEQQYIAQGIDCKYFTLSSDKYKYKMFSNIKGKKLLPFDERSLEYKVANVKATNVKYDLDVLEILNPKNDIANQNFALKNNIVVGNGWYPQELPNMRWGSDNVELLILNSELENIKVEFDLEPGPSLKELPLKIDVLNDSDKKIGHIEINKREKIIINIPVKENERYQIIKLKVLNDTKTLSFDPRDLNFRVFSMKVVE